MPKTKSRKGADHKGAKTGSLVREIERSLRSIKLYPVAVGLEAKNSALDGVAKAYSRGGDSVRQHTLFLINETVSQVSELKSLKAYEHFRLKSPKLSPGAIRMGVYREMFDYNTSVEGVAELILLLGRLEGDEPAKLLTHFFSVFCSMESETNRMLRNAAIEALGDSESKYALDALLEYARLSDSDRLFGRLVASLALWAGRIDKLDMKEPDKQEIKEELKDLMAKEEKPTQYG